MANDESSQPAMNEAVGQQLQKAREAAGLSVSEVAGAQHLRPSVIQAIESGDYSQIDSELFLKGYVRTYAKQVGLNADSVIADLDRELEPIRQQREQEYEANPLVDIERRRRRKRQVARTLFFLVILGVAGYLAFAFLMPGQDSGEAQSEAPGVTEAPQEQKEPAPETTEPSAASVPSASEAVELSSLPEPAAEPDTLAPLATEIPAGGEALSEPVAEQIPTVVETPEPALQNASGLATSSDMARLQIQFTGNCWIQVRDANGNQLVSSLQRAGDSIDVSGEAPLKVVIGAVDAVGTIRFQGEPVELGSYRAVNNRSEFTLTI